MNSKAALLVITAVMMDFCLVARGLSQTEWLSDSSRAIQFGVGSSFNVQAFDNKSVSIKFHITPLRAMRYSLSFSGSVNHRDRHEDFYLNGVPLPPSDISYDPTHSWDLEVSAFHLWYIDTGTDVFLFLGAGPVAEYYRDEYDYGSGASLRTGWSAGVGGAVGAEWFVHRRISLHAEYQASAEYSFTRERSTQYDYSYGGGVSTKVTEYRYDTWSVNSRRVLFGFSVYF